MDHPRFGNILANQVSAEQVKIEGSLVWKEEVRRKRRWGREVEYTIKVAYTTPGSLIDASDDDCVRRIFHYRCGLIRAILSKANGEHWFVLIYDGWRSEVTSVDNVIFTINPDDLADSQGEPIAVLGFKGVGPRHGPFEKRVELMIDLIFRDQAHIDQYVDMSLSSHRRLNRRIVHRDETYELGEAGRYYSESGSILPVLLVAWYLLSTEQRDTFAQSHPEVLGLLEKDEFDEEVEDGEVPPKEEGEEVSGLEGE